MEGWKQRYALSDQGVKDLRRGIAYSVLANISVMLPVVLLAVVLDGLLKPLTGGGSSRMWVLLYTVAGIVILAVVFLSTICSIRRLISALTRRARDAGFILRKN